MKKMILAFLVLALVIFAFPPLSFAEEGSDAVKINMGDWELAGQGEYFRSNTSDWRLTISPKVEYFFLNRFSAGGRVVYNDGNRIRTETEFGPALTWYFALINRVGLFVDQSVLYVNPRGATKDYFAGETGIGANYFVSPSVALGPSLRSLYYFNGGTDKPEGGLALRLALSVFL